MALQFTQDLSTTVAEIDDQHMELFKRVDGLLVALQAGRGRDELIRTIQFLTDYVVFHFGVEEKYMEKYGYVDRLQHKAQHELFVMTFLRMKDRLLLEEIDPQNTEETKQLVVDWLINHIRYSDKGLGLFLKRKLPA